MITDNEIDQLTDEFKKWRKERAKKNPPTEWVSNGTCPDAGTSIAYTYPNNVISKEFIDNQPYNRLQEIIDKMTEISVGLKQSGVMGYGLSLETQIEDLKKLILGVRE